jgi:outer membrane biosynthesis protein TonB
VIAGVIGVVALVIWVVSLLLPSPQDEPTQATRDDKTAADKAAADKAAAALATQSPPVPRERGESPAPAAPVAAATAPTPAPVPPPAAPFSQAQAPKPAAQGSAPEKPVPKKPDVTPKVAAKPPTDVATTVPTKPPAPRTSAAPGAAASDAAVTPLLGRYDGTYSGPSESGGFTLELTGVSNGVISGLATLGGQSCRGRYPIVGNYKNEKLQMRAPSKGGPAGDCPLSFTLAPEGRWLMGATDSGDKIRVKK